MTTPLAIADELALLDAQATDEIWTCDGSVLFGPNNDDTGITFDNPYDARLIAALRNNVSIFLAALRQSPTPPAAPAAAGRCNCWLGAGATCGDSRIREACPVHGDGAAADAGGEGHTPAAGPWVCACGYATSPDRVFCCKCGDPRPSLSPRPARRQSQAFTRAADIEAETPITAGAAPQTPAATPPDLAEIRFWLSDLEDDCREGRGIATIGETGITHIRRLVAAADAADARAEALVKALERIIAWQDKLPESGKFYSDGTPMSYSAAYGSNGVRDYYRQVAADALAAAATRQPQPKEKP